MFHYTLKLKTNPQTAKELDKRFRMAEDIYKTSLKELLKRDRKMKKDPRYKAAYKLPKGKERNNILKELDKEYEISDFSIRSFASTFYRNARNYAPYIPSNVAMMIGKRAWLAYEKVKFVKGAKRVNFSRQLNSFESANATGLRIINERLLMGTKHAKLEVPIQYVRDDYELDALRNTLKYCRLIRRREHGKVNYYVQLLLDGTPPQKGNPVELNTTVGVNVGLTTVTTSSHYEVKQEELAPNVLSYQNEIVRLQRKLDRQRRANNPDNYNDDGTIKRGPKKWHNSKRYLKTKERLAELMRKQAKTREIDHKTMANKIVGSGNKIVLAQKSYKDLQRRKPSSDELNSRTGQPKSRKQYGRVIGNKAPSELVEIIKYKTVYAGKELMLVDVKDISINRFDHTSGEVIEENNLGKTRIIGGHEVDKKAYGAFLLEHVTEDGKSVDVQACNRDFEDFLKKI